MTTQTTVGYSARYSLDSRMDSQQPDKEERKREYNRLAQREFRRRRKEHLKNLEHAQKEQNSEQSEEIERLRYQNDELRRENETLRLQIYGSSSSSTHGLMSTPISIPHANDGRSYSLSPSISNTSISGTASPPATLGSDMMPLAALSMASAMLPSSMQDYANSSALPTQPYSMVHPSGLRHNSQSSPESSGFRNSRSTVGPSFQSLNVSQPAEAQALQVPGLRMSNAQASSAMSMTPYDRAKARADLRERFRPLLADPSVVASPERHLATLRSMSDSLPVALKPTKAQLETPHYCGIDLLASPSLRDRLLTVTADVAQSFITETGINGNERDDVGQLVIWGDDPLNEMSWEFSQAILERWGWILGRDWVARANFWRRQRGAASLPGW